jgi:hypothetical protein
MNHKSDNLVEKTYDRIAEDYVRRGYRVSRGGNLALLPDFLQGFEPDLIAERRNDRVVVEVKRTRSLRGSNDLVRLAQEIAAHPGWRLELVALGKDADELSDIMEPEWLEKVSRQAEIVSGDPAMRPYMTIYQVEVLGVILRGLAIAVNLRPHDKSTPRVAGELTYHGVIDQETFERVRRAIEWRNEFVHGRSPDGSEEHENLALTELCRELHVVLRREAANSKILRPSVSRRAS